jgi:hypothetical protein
MLVYVGNPNSTGTQNTPVITTHGMNIKVQDAQDMLWYIGLSDVAGWSWTGGKIQKGDGDDTGVAGGTNTLARTISTSDLGQIDWRNIVENDTDAGAIIPLFDVSTVNSIGWLCPNCESEQTFEYFQDGAMIANGCYATAGNTTSSLCGPGQNVDRTMRAFSGGRLWLHDTSCMSLSDSSLDDADDYTLQYHYQVSDNSTANAAIAGATLAFNGTQSPGQLTALHNVLAHATNTSGAIALVTTVADDPAATAIQACKLRASILVGDTP